MAESGNRERGEFAPHRQGWGIAAAVVLLAAVLTAVAFWIRTQTYCEPRDPLCRAEPASYEGGH